jgi:hypothetical protein
MGIKGEHVGVYVGEVRRYPPWSMQNSYSIIYPNMALKTYRVDGFKERMSFHWSIIASTLILFPLLHLIKG